MQVKNPKFEISAVSPKQYPSNGLPEIVLVGNEKIINSRIKELYGKDTILIL